MKKSKLLVVVSDLHVGSDVGLLPAHARLSQGNLISFGDNHAQAWLWECWTDAIKQVKKIAGKDPFILLINGDAVEGIHHRSAEVIAAAIEEHTEIAIECLKPISSLAQTILVTLGTEVHTKGVEHVLAEKLGAVMGRARNKWLFTMNGVQCDACHHMPTTTRAYLEASQMSIALGNARIQASRAGHPPSRVFLRAHRHLGGHYSDGDCLLVVTGAFQMLTRYGYKIVPDSIPRPSVAVLDWRSRLEGSLPVVHNIQYTPPPPVVIEL